MRPSMPIVPDGTLQREDIHVRERLKVPVRVVYISFMTV
jgi:hypothetical protein